MKCHGYIYMSSNETMPSMEKNINKKPISSELHVKPNRN